MVAGAAGTAQAARLGLLLLVLALSHPVVHAVSREQPRKPRVAVTAANSYALKAMRPPIAAQLKQQREEAIVRYFDPLTDVLTVNGECAWMHRLSLAPSLLTRHPRRRSQRYWLARPEYCQHVQEGAMPHRLSRHPPFRSLTSPSWRDISWKSANRPSRPLQSSGSTRATLLTGSCSGEFSSTARISLHRRARFVTAWSSATQQVRNCEVDRTSRLYDVLAQLTVKAKLRVCVRTARMTTSPSSSAQIGRRRCAVVSASLLGKSIPTSGHRQ
jgi:hypothetical protein